MKHISGILIFCVLILFLFILAACGASSSKETPSVSSSGEKFFLPMSSPTVDTSSCLGCAAATLSVAQTQEKSNNEIQAAATANIIVANAQATLNSVNATANAAQVQQKNQADIVAAQITATAAVANANLQATLASSAATQNAAFTQDALQQTQIVAQATSDAQATLAQQSQAMLAAGTQTTVANQFLMMTQVAVATLQWNTDQERQRQAQQEGSAIFLWTWCMPSFILMLGGLFLYGSWRWLGGKQADQRHLERPGDRLHLPRVRVIDHRPDDSEPYIEAHVSDRQSYQLTKPDDQVGKWIDEVKREISNEEKKDENGNTDS
jgi:hypothetical protein